jgi:hypothetical protein
MAAAQPIARKCGQKSELGVRRGGSIGYPREKRETKRIISTIIAERLPRDVAGLSSNCPK